MRAHGDRQISVRKLREILEQIPDTYTISVNRVGNFLVSDPDAPGDDRVGYIEIGDEEYNLFQPQHLGDPYA